MAATEQEMMERAARIQTIEELREVSAEPVSYTHLPIRTATSSRNGYLPTPLIASLASSLAATCSPRPSRPKATSWQRPSSSDVYKRQLKQSPLDRREWVRLLDLSAQEEACIDESVKPGEGLLVAGAARIAITDDWPKGLLLSLIHILVRRQRASRRQRR